MEGRLDTLDGRVASVDHRVHQTRVLVENMGGDIKQVAEGIDTVREKLDRHIADTAHRFDDIESVFRNYRAAAGRKRTTARAKPSR